MRLGARILTHFVPGQAGQIWGVQPKMTDIVDVKTRSRMMAGIRGKDTKPEMAVRRFLHGMGYRYRLHRRDLPSTPDLVLPKYGTVIFVHGCFWHGHDCRYFRLPKTRTDFWDEKISGNRSRDRKNRKLLEEAGWQVITIHECEIRDKQDWQQRLLDALGAGSDSGD